MLQGQKKDPKWHCPKANGQTQGHTTGIQYNFARREWENPLPNEKRGFLSLPGSHDPAGLSSSSFRSPPGVSYNSFPVIFVAAIDFFPSHITNI